MANEIMLAALKKVYGLIKQCGIQEDMDCEEHDYLLEAIESAPTLDAPIAVEGKSKEQILGKWNAEFSAKDWEERSLAAMEEYASQFRTQPSNKEVEDIRDNLIELLKEDLKCVHLYLDDKLTPRKDSYGNDYSVVGRIKFLERYCYNPMIIKSDNICPTTKLPCDDECCPVGAVCNLDNGHEISDIKNTENNSTPVEDMKEALIQIEQFSDCGSNHVAIVRIKEIASKALAAYTSKS